MRIAFRVDASREIGIGHLMRCLALSEELKKQGHKCYILSETSEEIITNKISEFQVEFYKINELADAIKISKENCIDWIITDCYSLNSEYIKKLKENFKVLSIDDNALIHYYSDAIVNQNIGADKLDYSAEEYTRFFLGSKYVMMRNELLKRNEKKEKDKVKKILITLGGADKDNFTLEILKILKTIDENVEVIAVIGPFNPFYNVLKEYVNKSNLMVNLIKSPEKMTDIYLESDIAISAGGTSCYELAYYGIPNLIITIAENQLNIAKELDRQGISIYLGDQKDVKSEKIKEKVKELINNHSLRKSMSQNGRDLVDGLGKRRIADFMESYN